MKIELRLFRRKRFLLLIAESEQEHKAIDEIFGSKVQGEGFIANVKGTLQLADGYGEAYFRLEKV